MRAIFLFTIVCVLGFAQSVSAQVFDDFDKPLAANDEFCKIMDSIQSRAAYDFIGLQDSGTVLDDTIPNESWPVKRSLWFPGANDCTVYTGPSGRKIFIATFMSKYDQDGLVSSYNNLLKQVQDCLPKAYIETARKKTVYEKLFPAYDIELSYNGLGMKSEKPVFRIFIYHSMQSQVYTLKMQIASK
jgi:hypothetical protein